MNTVGILIKRNIKLYFKDKGLFFTSLITPLILLVLYSTFLAKVYRDSFSSSMPEGLEVSNKLIEGCVGGELMSSLLAVCCITVAFCANTIVIQDKYLGSRTDLCVSPVKGSKLALGYYIATLINTLIVCYMALGACLIYVYSKGSYITGNDILFIVLDIFLLSMFGTVLTSIINLFLSTPGQASAVGTIMSAGYGFICGAYMPISNFGSGIQRVISFLPGTYGTSLIRNHCLRGVYSEMERTGFPDEVIEGIKDSIDCNLYFFDKQVSINGMFAVITGSVALLLIIFIVINLVSKRK